MKMIKLCSLRLLLFHSFASVANGAVFRRNPDKLAIEQRHQSGDALEKEFYERNL